MPDSNPILSEQLGRVDGAQNDILKAIVKAFGITLSNEKIDEIADLVTASGKFKQGALLSSETTTLYPDLPENPSPDDVFSILSSCERLKLITTQTPTTTTVNLDFSEDSIDERYKIVIKNSNSVRFNCIFYNESGSSMQTTGNIIKLKSGNSVIDVSSDMYFSEDGPFIELDFCLGKRASSQYMGTAVLKQNIHSKRDLTVFYAKTYTPNSSDIPKKFSIILDSFQDGMQIFIYKII